LKLRSIILTGALIRLILMPFSAHPFDVNGWYGLSQGIIRNPTNVLYFPPMLYYTLIPIAYAYSFTSRALGIYPISLATLPQDLNPYPQFNLVYITDPIFNLLVKLPFLISDVLATIILFRLTKEFFKDKEKATAVAMLWFLNPYLIWISAVWGMFDTLPALFSLLSLWLLTKRRFDLSASSLAMGFAYKLYPVLFLIPTILFIKRLDQPLSSSNTKALRYVAVFAASALVLFLPTIPIAANFSHSLLSEAPEVGRVGFGLTFWSILLAVPVDQNIVVIISNLIVIAMLALTYLKASKSNFKDGVQSLAEFQLCCVLSIFIGFRFVAEQFFVWALPYLAFLSRGGRVKLLELKGLVIIGLSYAVVNLLLPFFFLPTSPWIGGGLLWAVRLLRRTPEGSPSGLTQGLETVYQPHFSATTLILSGLGIVFTLIAVMIFVRLAQTNDYTYDVSLRNPAKVVV
jgi:Gpi18-like mannosyltransferase